METKVVLKLDFHHDKLNQNEMKTIASVPGFESFDMKDKELTVIIDDLASIRRKLSHLCHTETVSVGAAKEPEKKKAVLKLYFHDYKLNAKEMMTIASVPGFKSFDMKGQKLTVIFIDLELISIKLEKLCHTKMVSVGAAKEPEKKKEKPKTEKLNERCENKKEGLQKAANKNGGKTDKAKKEKREEKKK